MYYIAVIFALCLGDISAQTHDCRPSDCFDLSCYGLSEGKDGPHTIYPVSPNQKPFNVSCDQDTDGGGWIMYQRRATGTVNFTRTWQEYKDGFGDNGGNTTELWLGNEKVYQLVQIHGAKMITLRIEVDAFDGAEGWIEAENFTLSNEALLYTIYWNSVTRASVRHLMGSWGIHRQRPFKTFDQVGGQQSCLDYFKGGWWYDSDANCGQVFINGEYLTSAQTVMSSIYVYRFKPGSLKRSRMMFRETNYVHACNNPCENGATCVHVANPRGRRCVCKTGFCGPECEWKNLCKNGGTCEYRKTTNSTTCKCSAQFVGPKCEDAVTMPPTTPSTIITPVVGGILLLLMLCVIVITASVIYTRRQWKKQKEEEEKEEADSEYQYMLSMFGF